MELRSIALTRLGTKPTYTENFMNATGCVQRAMINVAFLSTRSSNRIIVMDYITLCPHRRDIIMKTFLRELMKKFRNEAKLAYICHFFDYVK